MEYLYNFIERTFGINLADSKFTLNQERNTKGETPEQLTMRLWNGTLKDWEYSNLVAWTGKRNQKLWKIGTYIVQIYRRMDSQRYYLGSIAKVIDRKENPYFEQAEHPGVSTYSAETGCNCENTRYTYKLEPIDLGIYKGYPLSIVDYKLSQAYQLDCATLKDKIVMQPICNITSYRFPGYDNINHSFRQMQTLIDLPEWQTALKHQKGVYMLVDTATGKQYIGSAYGRNRLWSRWKEYLTTGHGGNIGLVPLGQEYIFENFKMVLLERCSDDMSDEEIIAEETKFKEKFMTKIFGYNNN
jgi:hypothetical protein